MTMSKFRDFRPDELVSAYATQACKTKQAVANVLYNGLVPLFYKMLFTRGGFCLRGFGTFMLCADGAVRFKPSDELKKRAGQQGAYLLTGPASR